MGVDISLHIEIRKQNEWHLMTFDIPLLKQDYHHEYHYSIPRYITEGITILMNSLTKRPPTLAAKRTS